MNINSTRLFGVTLGLVAMVTGCAMEMSDADQEAMREIEQEIINGTDVTANGNSVAIYRYGSGSCEATSEDIYQKDYSYTNEWWPRPCSGTRIRQTGTTTYILTARHCVTKDGEINGPLITSASQLQVTTEETPGVLATTEWNGGIDVTGIPPSYTVNATVYASGSPVNSYDYAEDLAIIRADNITGGVFGFSRTAIFASSEGAGGLNGYNARSRGYGRSTTGSCYGHNGSGAGVLREANSFGITASYADYFDHINPTLSGQKLAGGDSGGMMYLSDTLVPSTTNLRVIGVNSTGSQAGGGMNLFKWIQGKMGYMYLASRLDYAGSKSLGAGTTGGSIVGINYQEDSTKTRLTYDATTKQIKFTSGLCIQAPASTGTVTVQTCSTSTRQKWDLIGSGGYVKNVSSGKCMARPTSGTTAEMTDCGGGLFVANAAWNFFADNAKE